METVISTSQLLLWALSGFVTIESVVLWYFIKGVMEQQKEHTKELSTMHERFVKKDDFKDFKIELWQKLDDLKEQVRTHGK
jgi:hypothetical protein